MGLESTKCDWCDWGKEPVILGVDSPGEIIDGYFADVITDRVTLKLTKVSKYQPPFYDFEEEYEEI